MSNNYENVEEYLKEVDKYLGSLPDKEQILKELRAHIWDQANRIAESGKGLTIQESFDQALMMMENPKTLAAKFLEEETETNDWKSPVLTPENKITNEQFIVLAVLGFGAVAVLGLILQIISNDPLVSIIAFFLGLIAIVLFIMFLYISDEKLFREQLYKLRVSFQRSYDEIKEEFMKRQRTPPTDKEIVVFYSEDEEKSKEVGFWGAFGEHLGGFIGGILTAVLIAFLIYLDISEFPLFNNNWYFVGAAATYISLGTILVYSAFLVLFGKIRIGRLLSAIKNFIEAACAVILLLYYPFTLSTAIFGISTAEILANPDLYKIIGSADIILKWVIGVSGVISFLSALYDIFKFGSWKPSDRKSLI
ncbi:MAG: hypothetical protein ACTSW1_07910 [Candidatus Hodarchaeales archaeon]